MEKVPLSKMPCYAGNIYVEVTPFSPDLHDNEGIYLQFVEGCGYDVKTLTPNEAEILAKQLQLAAIRTRKSFVLFPILKEYVKDNQEFLTNLGITNIEYDASDDEYTYYGEEGYISHHELGEKAQEIVDVIENLYSNHLWPSIFSI